MIWNIGGESGKCTKLRHNVPCVMSIYSKYLYPNLNVYVYKGEGSIKE